MMTGASPRFCAGCRLELARLGSRARTFDLFRALSLRSRRPLRRHGQRNQAAADRDDHGVRPVVEGELVHRVAEVVLHGLLGDGQRLTDLAIALPQGRLDEDVALAGRQVPVVINVGVGNGAPPSPASIACRPSQYAAVCRFAIG